jgi:thiol-disulfide isomerase/thioredoxin
MSQQLTLEQVFAPAMKLASNPSSIQPDPKKNQHLRKKRNLEIIERNFLIRRFYYPIRQNSEYEMESKAYGILNHFDYDSPPYNKFSCIKNFSANAFWFLICSNYFPYFSNELIDQKECIPSELKKLIDYINTNNISSINKKNNYEKFTFLKELKKIMKNFSKNKNLNEKNNLFQTTNISHNSTSNIINLNENKPNINLSNLSCTNNISSIKTLLDNLIKYFEHENEVKILSKIKKEYLLTSNYNRDIRVPEDFELDIKYHTKSFDRFREEILDKEEQNEEDENDDIVCYVCGDGEYEDDNLILYCSKCNMTVHQKCYGVLVIPEEDWICHLCRAFNDINVCNNMECILCPNLGGAMKPCTLRKSSHSYKMMIKNRKNPSLKDNNYKNLNINNNNNLINSIFDENKDDKKMESNSNLKSKNISNFSITTKIIENNICLSDMNSNQTPNIENLMSNNNTNNDNNSNINIIANGSKNSNNNSNEMTSNNKNITNSPNNNSNNDKYNNNTNQHNNNSQSCHSSNINKDIDSIYSNSFSNKNITKDDNNNNNNTNPINNKNNQLLKKQQKSKSQNEIYLSDKVAKENAWVHLSCALWLPELNLANFEFKEKIKGVENLPKKRLQEICNICLKCGYGPTIKCEKCDYHFHPECARRLKKFFLEINENENGETSFLAYCNKDAPPKHLKKYELIKQRKRDEIKKFSSLIQKDISSLNKIPEDKQYNIFHAYCNNTNNIEIKKLINEEKKIFKKINKNNNLIESNSNFMCNSDPFFNESVKKNGNNNIFNNYEKNIELTSSEKKYLINAIREMLIEQSNLTLEINTNDYSIKQNNNIKFTFEDMTFPEKFSWCFLKESQDYLNGISNYETFKIYKNLIVNKGDFAKNILKEKIIIPEKPKKHKNKIRQKHKKINEEDSQYCICNSNKPDPWVGCDNDNGKCPGKMWYHLSCLPELKNYNIDYIKEHFVHYYCPKCREMFKFENEIKKEKEVNEINVPLNPEEVSHNNINIDIAINNNADLELKKEESNIMECVDIFINEEKLDNNKKDNKENKETDIMNIEEKKEEENKEKNEDKKN